MAIKEFVGTLDFDSIASDRMSRKIPEVGGYNYIAAANDGSREDVAVVRIREFERRNKRVIPCDQAVTGRSVHEITSAFDCSSIAMRLNA